MSWGSDSECDHTSRIPMCVYCIYVCIFTHDIHIYIYTHVYFFMLTHVVTRYVLSHASNKAQRDTGDYFGHNFTSPGSSGVAGSSMARLATHARKPSTSKMAAAVTEKRVLWQVLQFWVCPLRT